MQNVPSGEMVTSIKCKENQTLQCTNIKVQVATLAPESHFSKLTETFLSIKNSLKTLLSIKMISRESSKAVVPPVK